MRKRSRAQRYPRALHQRVVALCGRGQEEQARREVTVSPSGGEVGVVFELHGQIRLVDVFDPDGNRIQLAQSLDP